MCEGKLISLHLLNMKLHLLNDVTENRWMIYSGDIFEKCFH